MPSLAGISGIPFRFPVTLFLEGVVTKLLLGDKRGVFDRPVLWGWHL